MKTKWSKSWKSSKQPRRQRKYRANAPLHIRKKMMKAPLSKELKTKYKIKNITVRVNDRVKVLKGKYKGKIGKITRRDLKNYKIFMKEAEIQKKDGTSYPYPISPSNIVVLELNLDDKKRKSKLESKNESPKKSSSA
ncbi:MAG: 50S ribosomal protein L24 [Candidatus Woesearchaeota archaeon]|nr:MAG: 50S ribosomal protein L24 [Candidatus Woesearchaeota archaeon]